MSNYMFTICGRAGSKGIRGKNTSSFLGIPLVYYTLASIALFQERHPEHDLVVVVSTDSAHLVDLVKQSKMDFYLVERPEYLSTDRVSKLEVIRHAYKEDLVKHESLFDAVIDLDITAPLRTVSDIEGLIDKRKQSSAATVFSVTTSRRNPYFNMVSRNDSGYFERVIASDYSARQDAPQVYDMNASMYAYAPSFLESEAQMFDVPCDVVVMRDTGILDLDNSNDLSLMQVVARYLFDIDGGLREIRDKAAILGS